MSIVKISTDDDKSGIVEEEHRDLRLFVAFEDYTIHPERVGMYTNHISIRNLEKHNFNFFTFADKLHSEGLFGKGSHSLGRQFVLSLMNFQSNSEVYAIGGSGAIGYEIAETPAKVLDKQLRQVVQVGKYEFFCTRHRPIQVFLKGDLVATLDRAEDELVDCSFGNLLGIKIGCVFYFTNVQELILSVDASVEPLQIKAEIKTLVTDFGLDGNQIVYICKHGTLNLGEKSLNLKSLEGYYTKMATSRNQILLGGEVSKDKAISFLLLNPELEVLSKVQIETKYPADREIQRLVPKIWKKTLFFFAFMKNGVAHLLSSNKEKKLFLCQSESVFSKNFSFISDIYTDLGWLVGGHGKEPLTSLRLHKISKKVVIEASE